MVNKSDDFYLMNGDCLELMKNIPDKSIHMIFADLPYSTTQNQWDKEIPLSDYVRVDNKIMYEDEYMLHCYKKGIDYDRARSDFDKNKKYGLWTHFTRIIKDNGVIALWAQAPFDTKLINTSTVKFRYRWVIEKTKATGHLNAKKMPMKAHENILIFYNKLPTYNPQMTEGHSPVHSYTKHTSDGSNYGKTRTGITGGGSTSRYPRDVLKFKWDTQKSSLHPTQKPVEACEYVIKTYTNAGDIILDCCMGSGTTGVAVLNTDRKFIGIEKDKKIFLSAENRINNNM